MVTDEKIYNAALMRYRLGNLLILLGVLAWLPFIVLRIAGEKPSLFWYLLFHLAGVIRVFGKIALFFFSGASKVDWITSPASWIALATLIALELVLGVDNIIFISILAGKLPKEDQPRARTTGIMLAVITRVMLLLSLSWIISLEEPLFHVLGFGISGHDLILIVGGLFLLGKSTFEIHEKLEGQEGHSFGESLSKFYKRHRSDHAVGYCLLARFGDHSGWHGQ